jgi:pantothenate kinase
LFQETLGIDVQKEDEMQCLITGLNFLVQEIPYEVFTYDERRAEPMSFDTSIQTELFPYLVIESHVFIKQVVNIGSGVSILKVTSEDCFERVSGTSLGGGTLWGLLSLLTDAESYDEMLELSKYGDNKNVDMLVGDIYGGSYSKIGLKATTIASSFGKVFKTSKTERKNFRQEDISRSLLVRNILPIDRLVFGQ